MPHLPKQTKRKAYQPKPKAKRHGNKAYRFYNSWGWRKVSKGMRKQQPMCEVYPELVADVVDHIIPIVVDDRGQPKTTGGAPLDERNLMCMSHKAHNKKRGKEAHNITVESIQTINGLVPPVFSYHLCYVLSVGWY